MNRSENIMELTKALAQAQGQFASVKKTGKNPFLKNEYATLDDVIAAIREALHKNGLSFAQPLRSAHDQYVLETILMHESGEWLSTEITLPSVAPEKGISDLQVLGKNITYMRRYMLTSLLGVNSEADNDGNSTDSGNGHKSAKTEHWIDKVDMNGNKLSKRFWTWAKRDMGLNEEQVHAALEVEHLHDYTGTMGDAKSAISDWIDTQMEAEQPELEEVPE